MEIIDNKSIINELNNLWNKKWFLLTSGNYSENDYNSMTIAWGFFGVMWSRDCVMVVVRPTRHTFSFITKYKTFSLCLFNQKKYRDDLLLLGRKSGINENKLEQTSITPIPSKKIEAPSFLESDMSIECEILYQDKFDPTNFMLDKLNKNYPNKDYHHFFIAKIIHIS